jgi:hypothetical protein
VRGLLAALLTFLLYMGVQSALFHTVAVVRRLRVMLWLWLLGGVAYAGLFRAFPDDAGWLPAALTAPADWVTWANGAFLYWCLFAGYYQFVNMADNSVGVRSLIELARAREGALSLAELRAYYPYDAMLGRRLDRLVAAGFLRRDGERFRCLPKGRRAARLMATLKALMRLGPGG